MADDNKQAACESCRFWDRYYATAEEGLCRRYAPSPLKGSVSWPVTRIEDWCGEHQPKSVPEDSTQCTCGTPHGRCFRSGRLIEYGGWQQVRCEEHTPEGAKVIG